MATRGFVAFVVALLFTINVNIAELREDHYATVFGHRLLNSPLSSTKCQLARCSKIWCAKLCLELQNCGSASLEKYGGICETYHVRFYDKDAILVESGEWNIIQPLADEVYWEGWQLALRAQRDIGISVFSTWMDDATYSGQGLSEGLGTLEPGCLSINTSLPCETHYKSRLVSNWKTSDITMVKFLLLKDSQVRHEILFDGLGTNKTSWFSSAHVINSTWTDLTYSSFNYFSIEGHPNTRRFFINHDYHGCPDDYSWMVVIDGNDGSHPCSWDNPTLIPKFLYSTLNTKTLTGVLTDFEYAYVMAILVKRVTGTV